MASHEACDITFQPAHLTRLKLTGPLGFVADGQVYVMREGHAIPWNKPKTETKQPSIQIKVAVEQSV